MAGSVLRSFLLPQLGELRLRQWSKRAYLDRHNHLQNASMRQRRQARR